MSQLSCSPSQMPSWEYSQSPLHSSNSMFPNCELFRHPERNSPYGDPSLDRRVVRGNAVSHFTDYGEPTTRAARQRIARDRDVKHSKLLAAKSRAFRYRLLITGPPCVDPEPIREESPLEVIEEPPVTYKGLQSDWFPKKLVEPIFIPEQIFVDEETQILDGDLFDFDLEVEPYIEVLVGRTCQDAMFETVYQDELYLYSADRACYKAKRAGEKVELQRLVEQERRSREEKERRHEQFLEACRIQKEVEERVAAAVHVKHDLGELLPNVLEGFRSAGYLLENIKDALDKGVTPYLWNSLNKNSAVKEVCRDILTEMVRDITETRAVIYELLGEQEDEIPKLRPTCDLLHDSSDDDEGVLGDDQEWNIVEYRKEKKVVERKGSLVSVPEIPEHQVVLERIRALSLSPGPLEVERVSIVEDKEPDISWLGLIKKKDVWKSKKRVKSTNVRTPKYII